MRTLFLLLLLAPLARAQSVDELVDRAMRATTGPKERLETMNELLRREGGDAALARAGLDPLRDPEVVHMTVEALLDAGRAGPHMAAICRLLLSERHRTKVEERIYRYSENPEAARELVSQLAALARGADAPAREDVALQRAAVIALGRIPYRSAVDAIAAVWADESIDEGVRAECREELSGIVDVDDPERVLEYLAARRYATYADLIRDVSRRNRESAAKWRRLAETYADGYFAQAGHEQVLANLESGGSIEKRGAAKRARALAEAKDYGPETLGPTRFGERLVQFLLAELAAAGAPSSAARDVVFALVAMTRNRAFGDAGLPQAEKLRDALATRDAGGPESTQFAEAATELLNSMGVRALPVLGQYARRHGNPDVRVAAVNALGDIAGRAGADEVTRKAVGDLLASLLADNPPRKVRTRLIFLLRPLPNADAIPTIEKMLDEQDEEKALDRTDRFSAMDLLSLSPSDQALPILERIARTGRDEDRRIDAIEHGLVPRLARGAQVAPIIAVLAALVRDPEQPLPVRQQVLTSLGAQGHLHAEKLLGELAADANLEVDLRRRAADSRVMLGERLAKGNGDAQVTPEHLAAISRIIEAPNEGVKPDRIDRLAAAAIAAAERFKIPARLLRTRLAERREAREGTPEADVRLAWKDALDNAQKDQLTDDERRYVLTKYRALAKGRDKVEADLELLKLAVTRAEPSRFQHWLDALEGAVNLGDAALVKRVLEREPSGDFPADAAARKKTLVERASKLS